MRVWVALAVVAGLVSGCVGLEERRCEPGEEEADLRTPWVDGGYLRTDEATAWDTVVLQSGPAEDPKAAMATAGWSVEVERLSAPEADNFSVLRVSPGAGQGRLDLAYSYTACDGPQTGTISWDLTTPREGRSAEPGQGVHVFTAGFLENGTLFYTNIKAIDHDDWPRTANYTWEGGDPLPVYVYEEDRGEQPAYWDDPQAGTPVEGTVPGLGYYATIPGFNEALKGLSTNTVRVVRLAPEDAYTRAGAEDHPLYGEALVFYIKVIDVVSLPCPMETAWLCGFAPSRLRPS
ncbi:MAG: FKBP-type peptidyl-prolyl cis-trans isomerase [Thermoplasmatota archaeon]